MVLIAALLTACSGTVPAATTTDSGQLAKEVWLHQSGSGMFFGTAPDLSSGSGAVSTAVMDWSNPGPNGDFGTGGTLDVESLDDQFPVDTRLWVKYCSPGPNFAASKIDFQVQKVLRNSGGSFVTSPVTEFSVTVDRSASIVRFQLPQLDVGPGIYTLKDVAGASVGFWTEFEYLAQGQARDPSLSPY